MIRKFAKIAPKFWDGETNIEITKLGPEGHAIVFYLMTCTHSNMIGIYKLPLAYFPIEMGIPLEPTSNAVLTSFEHRLDEFHTSFRGAKKVIEFLCEIGFCEYDYKFQYIWVRRMAFYQTGESLSSTDNRVVRVNNIYDALPNLSYLGDFYDKYGGRFHIKTKRINRIDTVEKESRSNGVQTAFERCSDGVQSKEKEKEKEKEKKEEDKRLVESKIQPSQNTKEKVDIIFTHWKKILNHPNSKLDEKRKMLIKKALECDYSVEQLCNAITGCSLTSHNMGDNKQGQKYDGIHIIFKDADQIDRFIHNSLNPPRPITDAERFTQTNVQTLKRWADKKIASYAKT